MRKLVAKIVSDIAQIDRTAWQALTKESPTATWFQTPEAYDFYASVPDVMTPFVFAVCRETSKDATVGCDGELKGVVVGYVTREKRAVKQFFTRRAIIIGGPMLAEDISDSELQDLLHTTTAVLAKQAIYIETRNFNDYSRWRSVFESCGFIYQPHMNFHVDTSSVAVIDANLGKGKKRDIKTTIREGAQIISSPSLEQVQEYYVILRNLYSTKVKTPLFPWSFFEKLYHLPSAHYILIGYKGEIIGGTVCLELSGRALYEWFVCGKDGEYKSVYPSSYATYAGLCYAAEHDCPRFDMMGAGTPAEHYGVRDFKARFGGNLVEHGRYQRINNILLFQIGRLGVFALKLLSGSKKA